MKLDIIKKIEIPEGITLDIGKIIIKAKGPKGENQRKIFHPRVLIKKDNNEIIGVVLNTNESTVDASAKESRKLLIWGFDSFDF